ncbi:hypothetical protein ONZ45_g19559 [Pleurotus djamor]|nr:hypothetical protein ONZ45_g19559 [Pleurotus djamor]
MVSPPLPPDVLDSVPQHVRILLEKLQAYVPEPWPSDYAACKHASRELRTHAGQTALPGGKVDETDTDFLREAHEEVGLPLDSPQIHVLCSLEPFISLHKLVVTPVVAFLSDPSLLDNLKPSEQEVAHIFTHPLEALLDPSLAHSEPLVEKGHEHWPYETEFHNTTDSPVPMFSGHHYRMHRFRTSASPIKGLTSDILIKVAEIGFAKPPTYERYAEDQIHGYNAIATVLTSQEQNQLLS